jgi:hypothetical protein
MSSQRSFLHYNFSLNYSFLRDSNILCPRIQFDLSSRDSNFPSAEVERGFAEICLEQDSSNMYDQKFHCTWSKGGERVVYHFSGSIAPADITGQKSTRIPVGCFADGWI